MISEERESPSASWPANVFVTPFGAARAKSEDMIELAVAAGPEDWARLRSLFQFYAYDLSDTFGLDVDGDGSFRIASLDAYGSAPGQRAFLITVVNKLAGFGLVEQRSRLTNDATVFDVAEFFVMRKYRRRGVGEGAARALFDSFRGRWEVRQRAENAAATAFWRRVIGRYTGGRFEELQWDDARWRGPVQRFESSALHELEEG
jgi:predicted acetyltransferase